MPWTTFPDTLGQGPVGARGGMGGWTVNLKFSTDLTPGPVSGRVEFDVADVTLVEHIYISDSDRFANDIQEILGLMIVDDGIKIMAESNERKLAFYQIVSVTEESGYWDFEVVYLAGSGGFLDTENVGIGFAREGPQGIQGDTGDAGENGLFNDFETMQKTDGSFSTSSTTFVDVTGASLTFTCIDGFVEITVHGSFGDTGGSGSTAHDAVLGLEFNNSGTFHPLCAVDQWTDGSGNDSRLMPFGTTRLFSISAGTHTVRVQLRRRNTGVGTNAQVCATTDVPLTMTAKFSS